MDIKWGIIGVGDVAEVKSGPAFQRVRNSSLVAVMRRDAEKARSYAERHGVRSWYSDARQLIEDPDVNAIYVATPPDSHVSYAIAAMEAGKPVYVEKPMALNRVQAEKLLQAQQTLGGRVSVAHYRREQPYFKKVKELVLSQIGVPLVANLRYHQRPLSAEILKSPRMRWRLDPAQSGGGLFHDLAPHQIDLLCYIFGGIVYSGGLSHNQSKQYDVADIVSGHILFENDVLFTGQWAFQVSAELDVCEVIGSEGSVSFSIFNNRPIEFVNDRGTTYFRYEALAHVQEPMIAAVVSYFRGLSPNPCSVREGVAVMDVLDSFSHVIR